MARQAMVADIRGGPCTQSTGDEEGQVVAAVQVADGARAGRGQGCPDLMGGEHPAEHDRSFRAVPLPAQTQRLRHALHLLETTDRPVDRIADSAGFGSAASLRHHMRSELGVAPLTYRKTFRAGA